MAYLEDADHLGSLSAFLRNVGAVPTGAAAEARDPLAGDMMSKALRGAVITVNLTGMHEDYQSRGQTAHPDDRGSRVVPGGLPELEPLHRETPHDPVAEWVAKRIDPDTRAGSAAQTFLDIGQKVTSTLPGKMASELTGAGAVTRGVVNAKRGIEEGSPARLGGGAAEMALGVIPMAAGVRALRPAVTSLPGMIATVPIAAAAAGLPEAAEAEAMKTPRQLQQEALKAERAELQKQIDAITNTPMPAKKYSNKLTPEKLTAQRTADLAAHKTQMELKAGPYLSQLTELNKQLEKSGEGVLGEQEADLPFRQRHPGTTKAMMGTAMTLAALGPGVAAATNSVRTNRALKDITAERAAGNEAAVQRLQTELANRTSMKTKAKYAAGGTAAGAGEYTLVSALPEELDAQAGTPAAQKAASDQLGSWDYWLKRLALGGLAGVGGTAGGFTLAKIPFPHNTASARAQIAQPYASPTARAAPAGQTGTTTLGPNAWPPEAREAARRYLSGRVGDLDSVTTGDIVTAMAMRGIIPNQQNAANRLGATQDHLRNLGRPVRGEDVMSAPKTSAGRKLLAIPAAALPLASAGPATSPEDATGPSRKPDTGALSVQSAGPSAAAQESDQASSSPRPKLTKTPWGHRDSASGRFSSKTSKQQSTENIVSGKREQSVNSGGQSMSDYLRSMAVPGG